jgi:hypothetical protein
MAGADQTSMDGSESIPDDRSRLIAEARSMPLSRARIASFATAAPPGRMQEALADAIEEGDVHAATAIALAIGAAGGRITPDAAIRLIPDLENIAHVPIMAGITDGERLTTLLELIEQQRLSWEREALLLFLSTQLLDGVEPPRRLITALRSLAREPVGTAAGLLVGFAARALDNAEINSLAAPMLAVAEEAELQGVDKEVLAGLFAPVLDSLPEEEPRIIGDGYTVIRSEPKIGRNDPCPCGSGRKYKKCCAGRQVETTTHQSLVEQFRKLGARGARAKQLFELLRPGDLGQLNPDELTTFQLIGGFRKLALHRRWEDAERFMDALATRSDPPGGGSGSGYRSELIDEALHAGNLEFAERQLMRANLSESEGKRLRMELALARKAPDALERLEAAAAMGHLTSDQGLIFDCAFALLRSFPALGILAARGCINPERFLDSQTILMHIDRARDRLDLPPHEPWWEIFDLLLDSRLSPEEHDDLDDDEEDGGRQKEIDQLRFNLSAAQSRVSRLDKELSKREDDLESLTGEREQLAAIVEASRGGEYVKRVSELEGERQRLRAKIGELKGEISEGAAERAALRRDLAETADALRRDQRAPAAITDPAADDGDDDDEAEGEVSAVRPRKILIPLYAAAAGRSLDAFPLRVAADALQITARLAGGDAHLWSGVKHMRRAHDILSVRIGRTYRLLFRAGDERLEVLDLVRRRDLDAALQRLAGR